MLVSDINIRDGEIHLFLLKERKGMKFYYTQKKENPHIKYLDLITEDKKTITIASMDLMGNVCIYETGYDQEIETFVGTMKELYGL